MIFDDFQVGSVVDGNLRLHRLIASGGGGDVFEASYAGHVDRVAVKVLRWGPQGPSQLRLQRFLREARIAASLQSTHVARILDVVSERAGAPYLVMEYLEGETLAELLERTGPLPIPDAVDHVLQAIEPLREMHAAGIIHRDVKPSNVFAVRNGDGRVTIKLLDFGIVTPDPATEAVVDLTSTQTEIGTPLFMAPEQFLAAKWVDARADVWSLGVTLYQLLTGRPPFSGATRAELAARILVEPPDPIERARPEVPAALAQIVMRCLVKEPAARTPDVATLARELLPYAGSPPRASDLGTPPPQTIAALIESTLAEEAEAVGTAFETSESVTRRSRMRPPREITRFVMLPLVACGLLWLVSVAGRSEASFDARRSQARALRDDPPKAIASATPDLRAEPVVRDEPAARVVVAAPRTTPRAAPSPAVRASRPVAPRAVAPRSAPRSPAAAPPRPADTIDDRID